MKRLQALSQAVALILLVVGAASAEVAVNGFVEADYGVRTSQNEALSDKEDYTLEEVRAQLRLNHFGEVGEAFARIDFLYDGVEKGVRELEIREAFLRFSTFSNVLEVKAGRMPVTWGTGDLLFINDAFPRDWVSFFIGRAIQYLRVPVNAARFGLYGLPVDVDLVLMPHFTPDRLPFESRRLTSYAPPIVNNPPVEPAGTIENGELALRLSRYVSSFNIEAYGYWGFYGGPEGLVVSQDSTGAPQGTPFYPKLGVYGASGRGGLWGGVLWLEGGWYDSRQDRDGTDPLIPNSELRYLLGYERQFFTDFTAGAQYYGEWMQKYDAYLESLPPGSNQRDELRQLLTLRLEKFLSYQTIRLSLFTYWSPTDSDGYVRGFVSYRMSDEIELVAGANLFAGKEDWTLFGQFDSDDNIYARARYSF